MLRLIAAALIALTLAGCGACYREDKNADGTWPSWCADRFESPRPK